MFFTPTRCRWYTPDMAPTARWFAAPPPFFTPLVTFWPASYDFTPDARLINEMWMFTGMFASTHACQNASSSGEMFSPPDGHDEITTVRAFFLIALSRYFSAVSTPRFGIW